MSKEKAIKYIKAAQTAIDEVPYPCTTKAKLLLVDALKELEGDITKFNVVRYWGTYADGLIATCDTKEEAKSNPMIDKNFIVALTEVLRYFRDNGELKKAYESKKDSLADMANSSWMKALKEYVSSKNQEVGVDAELPDIDELIKKLTSDEFIEKKIKDILGDQASKDE